MAKSPFTDFRGQKMINSLFLHKLLMRLSFTEGKGFKSIIVAVVRIQVWRWQVRTIAL